MDHALEAAKMRAALSAAMVAFTGAFSAAFLATVGLVTARYALGVAPVVLWSAAAASLLFSAVMAGVTIVRVTHRGAAGNWASAASSYGYTQQGVALLAGVVLFTLGTVLALDGSRRPPSDPLSADVETLVEQQAVQAARIRELSSEVRRLREASGPRGLSPSR